MARLGGECTLLSESCHISNLSLLAPSFQEFSDGSDKKEKRPRMKERSLWVWKEAAGMEEEGETVNYRREA